MAGFIDKTFTILADILLKVIPASRKEKRAFIYYRVGMYLQARGRYGEATSNYFEALELEEDAYDRSFIVYNIGLCYENIGRANLALRFYQSALECNPNLSQAYNNMGCIYHYKAVCAEVMEFNKGEEGEGEYSSKLLYDECAIYWLKALRLAPDNYPKARNWLISTGRLNPDLELSDFD